MEDPKKTPTKASQRRGACGHIMAAFDQHQRCSRCRESKKGQDLCVLGEACHLCEALTPDQLKQLSTPKYRERKEKAKAASTSSSTVEVDPSTVTVLGSPSSEDRAALQPTGQDKGKKKKSATVSTPAKKSQEPGASATLLESPPPGSTGPDLPFRRDIAVSQMDLTAMTMAIKDELIAREERREQERSRREQEREEAWATRFARLEAKLVSSTFRPPPSSSAPPEREPEQEPERDSDDEDTTQPQEAEIVLDTQESDLEMSDKDGESGAVDSRPVPASSSQSQPHFTSHQPAQDTGSESDQEMSYRETMSALRHTLGWKIPDHEGQTVSKNMPWLNTKKSNPSGRLAVHLPVDDHLCDLMAGLQVSVAEGNNTRASEPSPLTRGQFLRGPQKSRWYSMYHEQSATGPGQVKWWSQEAQRLNTTFQNLCRPAASSAPHSLAISQDNLRRWERVSRDQSVMINHAAGMIRGQGVIKEKLDCLMHKLTRDLSRQFTLPESISENLQDLRAGIEFSHRLSSSVSNVIRDLTEGVLSNLANTVLLRRDSYIEGLRPGVSMDTAARLRAGPFHSETLFDEEMIAKAESELKHSESNPRPGPERKERSTGRYQPYPSARPREESSTGRSDWRRFGRKKGSAAHPKVKSQVSKPSKPQQRK